MSQAIIANGTLLQMGGSTSAATFVTVPEMKSLSGPSVSFDLLDATSHDSVGYFREFIPGLADGDNISGTMNWRPSNTVHTELRVDSYARALNFFKVVFPDTGGDNTVVSAAYIATISPKADIGAILEADLTLKITGQPVWAPGV